MSDTFSGFSSRSSLDYADFLFLDDTLFYDDYKVTAGEYSSDDFPGSDLVDRGFVFGRDGYNAPPLPFLKYSKFLMFATVLGGISFLLMNVITAVSFFSHVADVSFLFVLLLVFYGFLLILGVRVMRTPNTRFYTGHHLVKSCVILNSIFVVFQFWIVCLVFV